MREIKFRALCSASKKWVYGCFVKDYSGIGYITSLDGVDTTTVDADTLGQYTGLKDKNGTDIYEGDIIKLAHDWDHVGGYSEEHRVFKKETPKYKHHHIRVVEWEGGHLAHWVTNPQRCCLNTGYLIEVIGNIHENPELLTKED